MFLEIDTAIVRKWRVYFEENYHSELMTNHTKNLSPEAHKSQMVRGFVFQEIIGNWIKEQLPELDVKVSLSVGKDKYDTDDYDVLIENEFKIDIKSSKAIRPDYKKCDSVVIGIEEGNGLIIKGYYLTENLEVKQADNPNYLIPTTHIKKIDTLIKLLKEKYGNKKD